MRWHLFVFLQTLENGISELNDDKKGDGRKIEIIYVPVLCCFQARTASLGYLEYPSGLHFDQLYYTPVPHKGLVNITNDEQKKKRSLKRFQKWVNSYLSFSKNHLSFDKQKWPSTRLVASVLNLYQ